MKCYLIITSKIVFWIISLWIWRGRHFSRRCFRISQIACVKRVTLILLASFLTRNICLLKIQGRKLWITFEFGPKNSFLRFLVVQNTENLTLLFCLFCYLLTTCPSYFPISFCLIYFTHFIVLYFYFINTSYRPRVNCEHATALHPKNVPWSKNSSCIVLLKKAEKAQT